MVKTRSGEVIARPFNEGLGYGCSAEPHRLDLKPVMKTLSTTVYCYLGEDGLYTDSYKHGDLNNIYVGQHTFTKEVEA